MVLNEIQPLTGSHKTLPGTLKSLKQQKVALFGTAGFGCSKSYFDTILEKVKSYIPKSNDIIGNFMCQGKMTENVLERSHEVWGINE